jgi:hypothetical protein
MVCGTAALVVLVRNAKSWPLPFPALLNQNLHFNKMPIKIYKSLISSTTAFRRLCKSINHWKLIWRGNSA